MIYLDNAATTRVFDSAAELVSEYLTENYYNPSAPYKYAKSVEDCISSAKKTLSNLLGVDSSCLYFTSGATESNNWAINSAFKNKKGNIVVSMGEHSSVYEVAMNLKSKMLDVRFAPLNKDGTVNVDKLIDLVDDKTCLVSCIHVNNEMGAINPLREIAAKVKSKNPQALFHSDGAQGLFKAQTNLKELGVDLYSASAHKICAPKGIGLLYIAKGVKIAPLILGGGQQGNMRSGTENVPYIMAFARAAVEFCKKREMSNTTSLREYLKTTLSSSIGANIISSNANSDFIACVHIPEVKGQVLQNMLADNGVIVGTGSACSGSHVGNRVLQAMNFTSKSVAECIRVSFSVETTIEQVKDACKIITEQVQKLRSGHVK